MWVTVAKWLGLIAVGLALVMGPMIWHGKKIDAAYLKGFQDGENSVLNRLKQDGINRATQDMQRAIERVEEDAEHDRKVATLEEALHAALQKKPKPAECRVTPAISDILRHAASGDFGSN